MPSGSEHRQVEGDIDMRRSRSLVLAMRQKGTLQDYLIALISVGLAALLTSAFRPWVDPAPTSLFFCAVMLTAWTGGFWPGLTATVLSILLLHFLDFRQHPVGETFTLILFAIISVVTSSLNALRIYTEEMLRRQQLELEVRVAHRTVEFSAANQRLEEEMADRHRAEQTLLESEERFRTLFEEAPVAYHEIDREGTVRRVNRAECELLGLTASDILGKHVSEFVAPEQRDLSYAEVTRKLRGGSLQGPFVRKYRGANGQSVYVEIHERPILDSDGTVVGIRSAMLDITRRVKAEEHIRRLNADLEARVRARTEELERSNEALQQFAYSASHDLQEPLRMVSAYARLLERKCQSALDEDGREYLFYIVNGADRMSNLIKDLLAFSRAGSPTDQEEFEIDMEEAVRTAVRNLETSIEESGAVITASSEMPKLQVRRAGLPQVIQNLLSNSIKYRSDSQPQIRITCLDLATEFQFCISDNGLGFEQADAERAFGVFKRLHGRNYPGTGIGLAICKRIVERNGGRIWAESSPGQGSRFFFTIPKVSKALAESAHVGAAS